MTPRPMVPVSTLAPNERFALEQFLCGDWEARTAGMTFTEIVSQIAGDESATPLQIRGTFANTPKYVAECVHRLCASLDLHTTPLVEFAKGIADLPKDGEPYDSNGALCEKEWDHEEAFAELQGAITNARDALGLPLDRDETDFAPAEGLKP
jgi:hypothetical protein